MSQISMGFPNKGWASSNTMTFSKYLEDRMQERNLKREWIEDTLDNPDFKGEIALSRDQRPIQVYIEPFT